jgi:DNA-binding MarR family transcriptional regulator
MPPTFDEQLTGFRHKIGLEPDGRQLGLPEADVIADEFTIRLHDQLGRLVFGEHKLTKVQFNVLRVLHDAPARRLSQRDLDERLATTSSNTSAIVDRMVRRGLIDRELVESDRRARLLILLKSGETKMKAAERSYLECIRIIYGGLDEDRLRQALSVKFALHEAMATLIHSRSPRSDRPPRSRSIARTPLAKHDEALK